MIRTQEDLARLCAKHGTRDVHAARAAEDLGIPATEVTPRQRAAAKARNYVILYGNEFTFGEAVRR